MRAFSCLFSAIFLAASLSFCAFGHCLSLFLMALSTPGLLVFFPFVRAPVQAISRACGQDQRGAQGGQANGQELLQSPPAPSGLTTGFANQVLEPAHAKFFAKKHNGRHTQKTDQQACNLDPKKSPGHCRSKSVPSLTVRKNLSRFFKFSKTRPALELSSGPS